MKPDPNLENAVRRIASRAASIDDRLRDSSVRAAAEHLLAEWSRALGSREALVRRLSWDGLDEDAVRTRLAPPDDSPAAWTTTLIEALYASDSAPIADAAKTIPFAELWGGFGAVARRRVGDRWPVLYAHMEQLFIDHASRIAASVTYRAFDAARAGGYANFVNDMRGGGLVRLFEGAPVLARQLCRLTDTFCESTRELFARIDADAADLDRAFGACGDPVGFRGALSDRHDGGRQVAIITFESGASVVYKPGDQQMLARYQELVEFLRATTSCTSLPPTLEILDRSEYAWVELARAHATDDEAEAREYFRRAGGLVFLAWILNGRDLHMENIIATAAGPMSIDAEALLQPAAEKSSTPETAMRVAHERVSQSPLRSGLLTFPQSSPIGVYDIGGLSGRGADRGSMETPRWDAINTDAMSMTFAVEATPPAENLLQFRGRPAMPEEFASDVVRGFSETYEAAISCRDALLERIEAFRTSRSRLVLRPTDTYARVTQLLGTAPVQGDGFTASVLTEALYRPFAAQKERPLFWPLAREERDALLGLDVPRFTIAADAVKIRAKSEEEITGIYVRSGLDVVRAGVSALSAGDLETQASIVRTFLSKGRAAIASSSESRPADAREISADEALIAARAIADTIARNAVRGADGSITWLTPEFLRVGDRDDYGVAYSFYSGAAGIASFLATVDADLARATLAPLVRLIGDPMLESLVARERIGAGHGIGSMIYGLVAVARQLGDSKLLDAALHLSATLTADRIAADRDFDVEGGAAGAALALAALFDATGEVEVRTQILLCARHLIGHSEETSRAESPRTTLRSWLGADAVARAGFAHGASGIASALVRAGEEFWTAADEAYAFERTIYSPSTRNWPVIVQDESGATTPIDMVAWCHGAPGIALARLADMRLREDSSCRDEALIALETTAARGSSVVDHICCGTFGRVDVLLTAADVLDDSKYAGTARRMARLTPDYRLEEDESTPPFRPGFFRGLSGIGYTLMRIARPEIPPLIGFW